MTSPNAPPESALRAEFESWAKDAIKLSQERSGDGYFWPELTRLWLAYRAGAASRGIGPAREPTPLVTSDPDIMHGAPCVKGTRIPVAALANYANAGYSVAHIVSEYPDLSPQQVIDGLAWLGIAASLQDQRKGEDQQVHTGSAATDGAGRVDPSCVYRTGCASPKTCSREGFCTGYGSKYPPLAAERGGER